MIRKAILDILKKEFDEQDLDFSGVSLEASSFGDYSSSFPLKLTKFEDYQKPEDIAKFFVSKVSKNELFSEVTFSKPGFINFTINQKEAARLLSVVVSADKDFGKNENHKGEKARVEFVSANPTGPLHVGNARGGPLGDTLASILTANGYSVIREYINNNSGNQVAELGRTIAVKIGALKSDQELTYTGDYINDLSEKVKDKLGGTQGLSEQEVVSQAGLLGTELLFEEIIADCEQMGITFDQIVKETDLQKQLPKILEKLESKNLLTRKEGATWFSPNNHFLEDKDAVVVKSDGSYTYFASDIVYHLEKFRSGSDLIIDVFGSNTAGHVPKLRALAQTQGFDQDKFKVILYQFVRVKKGSEIVKMSKRAGNFITAREVLDEVGKDAFRFFLLMHSPNTHIDFDLDLAKKQSSENPVFYVQYAHARISSILAKANIDPTDFNPELLNTSKEKELTKKILEFPDLIEELASSLMAHHLAHYAIDLADLFHKFYEKNQVLTEDKEMTKARLALVKSTQVVLQNSLTLLGVSAPEHM